MDKKKKMASKMESKTYTNTRCGHCGKFGHHHDSHKKSSFSSMNTERKRQGYKPITDRASKGLYDFLDK